MFDARAGHVVGDAWRTVGVQADFRHDEEREPLGARRGLRRARQDRVDDVVGQVVIARSDEDLLALDAIGAVRLLDRLRLDVAEVAAGRRLGEAHGARPPSGDHRLYEPLLQVVRAEALDEVRRAPREQDRQTQGRVRPHDELRDARSDAFGQAHAAEVGTCGRADPTVVRQVLVGLIEAGRHPDLSARVGRPHAVSGRIGPGHAAPADLECFVQDHREVVGPEI